MRTKLARWMAVCGLVLSVVAALPSAVAQSAGEMKPLATAVIGSYDELMRDVDFLGSLGGQQQASQMVDQTLQMFTQNKGLAGLDKSKPIGLLLQTDGAMPGGAVCIPVTDANALLDVVKGFGITVADAGNGLQQLSTQQGQTLFMKSTEGWAMLSMMPQMLESVPADPGAILGPLAQDYDLALRVNVQNVPETYRQQAVDAMSQGAQQGMVQNEGETEEQFAERQRMLETQLEQMKKFMNELDEFTFGLSIDNQQQRAFIDVAYTAVPGTELARDIAANSNVTTNFAGFIQPDAAATVTLSSKLVGANGAQLEQAISQFRMAWQKQLEEDEELDDESRQKVLSAADDFIAAMKATIEAGAVDGGATLNVTPESLTFVAGGFIANPAKVESGLKKLAEVGKKTEEDMPEVKWAASKHKDVTFHTMQVSVEDNNEEARQLFGEKMDLAVGIGQKAVYFALGRNSLDAVKQVIDQSAATPNKPTAPLEISISLAQIMNAAKGFADEDDKPQIEMIAEMLNTQASGRDHVRIVSQPIENGLRMRIEAEEGVLRAIGMAAMQAQMQAAQ